MLLMYEKSGVGPPLLLVHGWPLHPGTYRNLLPYLEAHFTCYNLAMAGSRDGSWDQDTDFSIEAHAMRILEFAKSMDLDSFSLLAHDTGATIARHVAAIEPEVVSSLILMNTEIPNYRPPFIPFYQTASRLPLFESTLNKLMQFKVFPHSRMGFGECFSNRELLTDEFMNLFALYWLKGNRIEGLFRNLRGFSFDTVDKLDIVHEKIIAPTLFIWGEDDRTFPADLGEKMANSMPARTEFRRISNAKLLVYEEYPDLVAEEILNFVK